MKKSLLLISCTALLAIGTPAVAASMVTSMGVSELVDEQAPTITVEGTTVLVQWASGLRLEVVSLTGRAVANYKIEGPAQRIELNLPKGCYILKIGKVVRKITVR